MAIMASATAGAIIRTELSGCIYLKDEQVVPADYAMVYAKEYGMGTLTDEHGNYTLHIPGTAPKTVRIEISRIGYASVNLTVALTGGHIDMEPVYMDSQPLMLTASYVIPEGKTPAQFVLSKVWERSKQVRKSPFDYRADMDYIISTHELPVVAQAVPKAYVGIAKAIGSYEGYGPMIRYCLKHDDFSASAVCSRQVKGGQTVDFNRRLISSDQPLPDNVKNNVINLMSMFDLVDLMYGESNVWGEKWSKKHKFTLSGTYEQGDDLVDVLRYRDHRGRVTANVHVVEQKWMITKIQLFTKEGEVLRIEARDVGNGIYLPISMVLKPSVSMIRAEKIPELIESIRRDKNIPKKSAARMIEVLESHIGEDFNPYIAVSGNVRYRLL